MKEDNYWLAVIGPVSKNELGNGMDSPLRMAVRGAFLKAFGRSEKWCSSGWGMSEKKANMVLECWNMEEDELSDLLKRRR